MNAERKQKIRTAQRRMLRKMVHIPRLVFQESSQSEEEGSGLDEGQLEETYVEWLVRSTGVVEERREEAGVDDWIVAPRRRYWLWAGHVARRSYDTWLLRVTTWRDSAWQSLANDVGTYRDIRPSTRRWMKLEDPLRLFCSANGLQQWGIVSHRGEWSLHHGE